MALAVSPSFSPPIWLQQAFDQAFDQAKAEFLLELKDHAVLDLAKLTTIDDVYREAETIQQNQARSKTLRGLGRIKRCLDLLQQYTEVIEVFVQVKPAILALIWGPIKLILKMSSHAAGAFEKFVEVLVELGNCLPEFVRFTSLFQQHERLLKVLVLFYKDLLQLYQLAFKFFKTRWGLVKESLWPRFAAKLHTICANVSCHKDLFRSEVTLQEINEASGARKKDEKEREKAQLEQDRQNFRDMRTELAPCLYDDDLEHLLKTSLTGSGKWVRDNTLFQTWCKENSNDQVLWIHGIPGAGKTRLSASIINHLREEEGRKIAFAFLRHDTLAQNKPVRLLQSLIFQLLLENEALQPVLHEHYINNYRKLTSSVDFLRENLINVADASGYVYIVIDGLDEVERANRVELLKSLLDAVQSTPRVKLLVSSRKEHEISSMMKDKASSIRVNEHNAAEIAQFVETETHGWLSRFRARRRSEDLLAQLESSLKEISAKSMGMFLYVRLVLQIVMKKDTIGKALREIQHLPNGLREAYGRVLKEFTEDDANCHAIRTILRWVGCAMTPLKMHELLQILAVEEGLADFADEPMVIRDLEETCSPIIEIRNGFVHFVHFTAKEFFFGVESERFVEIQDAQLQAAYTCLYYLSIGCFHESNESRRLAILEGKFVLFQYAYYNWLGHVQACQQNSSPEQRRTLTHQLMAFKDVVADYCQGQEAPLSLGLEFQTFAEVGGRKIGEFLAGCSQYIERRKLGLIEYTGEISQQYQDPTVLSRILENSRTTLETFLCPSGHRPGCHCESLIEAYGEDLFYCDRYYCTRSRVGFSSLEDRDVHLKEHERRFKCEDLTCIFANLGFKTDGDRSRHVNSVHENNSHQVIGNSRTESWNDFSQTEMETLTLSAIRADEQSLVQSLLPHLEQISDQLLICAGQNASIPIIEHLVTSQLTKSDSNPKSLLLGVALTGAVESKSKSKVRDLLHLGAKGDLDQTQIAAVCTFDFEFMDFLMDSGVNFQDAIYKRDCIHSLAQKTPSEAVQLLSSLRRYSRQSDELTGTGFQFSARYGFLAGLEWFFESATNSSTNLLESSTKGKSHNKARDGFVVRDFLDTETLSSIYYDERDIYGTAIYIAASNAHGGNTLPGESRKACIARYAACVKYLLKKGADATLLSQWTAPNLENTLGVKNLQNYFGMKWEKIIDKYSPGPYVSPLLSDSSSGGWSDTPTQHIRKKLKRQKRESSKRRRNKRQRNSVNAARDVSNG